MQPEIEIPPQTAEPPPVELGPPPPRWSRLAWIAEFLLALAAATIVWSELGGQDMEIIPWYLKLAALALLSLGTVRLTIAVVEQPGAWGSRPLRWAVTLVLIVCAMFAITCYYHLHEPQDDSDDEDEGFTTSIQLPTQPISRSVVV